jgi:hypothetical protein
MHITSDERVYRRRDVYGSINRSHFYGLKICIWKNGKMILAFCWKREDKCFVPTFLKRMKKNTRDWKVSYREQIHYMSLSKKRPGAYFRKQFRAEFFWNRPEEIISFEKNIRLALVCFKTLMIIDNCLNKLSAKATRICLQSLLCNLLVPIFSSMKQFLVSCSDVNPALHFHLLHLAYSFRISQIFFLSIPIF